MATQKVPETGIGVKKPFVKENITKEEFERRIKCIAQSKRDIVWWAENFFKIVTLDHGLQPIRLYDKQKGLLKCISDNTRIVALASRQTGKTTTYTVFCLWYATLFNDKKILICANKLATAIQVMARIRKAYEEMPFWIKPGVLTYNKGEITFANNSSIQAFSTSSSAARGSTGNCLIIDEMAFIPKNIMNEFFTSTMPIISSSKTSKAVIVSTPNGASGLYYDIWQQANSKDLSQNVEGWTPFRINWWEVPGRDEQWKQQQIATIGLERWKQEFECDFLTSATKKLVPDDITEKFKMKYSEFQTQGIAEGKKIPIMSQNEDKLFEFTMWHEFQPNRTYAASGDIAEGLGGDSSILYVWDVTDLSNITMCAKFESNKISVVEFAFVASKILALYGNPYFIAERNGCSSGTLDSLRLTYQYSNIVREGKDNEIGVYSHISIKAKACLWAREMLTTQGFGFTIYDKDLLEEFTTFVKKDTKSQYSIYHALPPAHDDHMLSFIWLCWLLSKEVVDKYYFVCKSFTSSLGTIYPQILQPEKEYLPSLIEQITNDQMYKDFLLFKDQLYKKNEKLLQQQHLEQQNDIFFNQFKDPYFNDLDMSQTWKSQQNNQQYSGSNIPQFYVFGGEGFGNY